MFTALIDLESINTDEMAQHRRSFEKAIGEVIRILKRKVRNGSLNKNSEKKIKKALEKASKESRKYILLFAAFSLLYFLFMVKWVMPTIAGEEDFVHFGKYPVLGGDMTAAIKFIIMHPLEFIRLLFVNHMPEDPTFNNEKVFFYLGLVAITNFKLFFTPI